MNLFHKLAAVIDATADELDARAKHAAEATETANANAANVATTHAAAPGPEPVRAKTAQDLAEVYEAVTGQSADAATLDKLANDEQLLDAFFKLAEKAADADSLGGPAERDDDPGEPKTAAERAKRAEDRLAEWILS